MKHFRKNSVRRSRKDSEATLSTENQSVTVAAPLSPSIPTSHTAEPPLMSQNDQHMEERLEAPSFVDSRSSRRSSANSLRKPLPGLPASTSSPLLNAKTSANLRQLAISSSASSSISNLAPPITLYSHSESDASNASENWTAPEDAEGAYIRKTYAHFDASGIKGDGLVEGKEWTRERGARAVWDASESLATGEASCPHASPLNDQDAFNKGSAVLISSPLAKNGSPFCSSSRAVSKRSNEALGAQADSLTPGMNALGVEESLAHSSSSLGTHSAESTNDVSHRGHVRAESEYILEAERKEMMKNVDRYGFFHKEGQSIRSRITILPADILQSIPKRRRSSQRLRRGGRLSRSSDQPASHSHSSSTDDPYLSGNEKSSSHQALLQSITQTRESKDMALREREAMRVAKWDRMLQVRQSNEGLSYYALTIGTIRTKKLRKRIYKGIPDRWRSAAWWAILLGQTEKKNSLSQAEVSYKALLEEASPHDVQIDLDVPRTISGHVLFHTRYGQGQRSLFHVLHAFSMLCPQCGYCQGMGPIAATLLVYFTPEKAYAVLVELHNRSLYGLHSTFSPGFPGLVENFYVQKKLCMKLCPDILDRLESNGIMISSYATKWYITLYTNVLPFSTQLRLWDCFLLQGKDLLVIVAIAILWALQKDLLAGGFETAMNALTREFLPVDDDALLNWIFVVMEREDTRKAMREARREYRNLVKAGKEPVL